MTSCWKATPSWDRTGSQQTDAISTKTPTWGWIIRGNTITGAGTGLYLGNSDGTDPFIGGLIENNLIQNPIGYDAEIKFQTPRPTVPGMPTGQSVTIIRNNVFIKNDQASPDGNRPNLLVGGFPSTGAGSTDWYEVYGNLFIHNPREALFQASGRVTIHDNVFVDGQYTALRLQSQDLPLQTAYVYNNTIYSSQMGISFGNAAKRGRCGNRQPGVRGHSDSRTDRPPVQQYGGYADKRGSLCNGAFVYARR